MFARKLKAVLSGAVLAAAGHAAAATITFEDIASAHSYTYYNGGQSFSPLAGYTLALANNTATILDSAYLASTTSYAANGSDFLTLNYGTNAVLTSTASPVFAVSSIDLANLYYNGLSQYKTMVTLLGTRTNNATVAQTYTYYNNNTLSTNDFTTVNLTGFTNLKSFAIMVSNQYYQLAVDNIVIVPAETVPEPGSLAMLALGLGAIGAARRRKRHA